MTSTLRLSVLWTVLLAVFCHPAFGADTPPTVTKTPNVSKIIKKASGTVEAKASGGACPDKGEGWSKDGEATYEWSYSAGGTSASASGDTLTIQRSTEGHLTGTVKKKQKWKKNNCNETDTTYSQTANVDVKIQKPTSNKIVASPATNVPSTGYEYQHEVDDQDGVKVETNGEAMNAKVSEGLKIDISINFLPAIAGKTTLSVTSGAVTVTSQTITAGSPDATDGLFEDKVTVNSDGWANSAAPGRTSGTGTGVSDVTGQTFEVVHDGTTYQLSGTFNKKVTVNVEVNNTGTWVVKTKSETH